MNIVSGGKNIYGYDIGILMLESSFPRIVGDVGHARTWNFPVLYQIVKGSFPQKIVLSLTMEDLQPFIDAALTLKSMGVKAITTSCGFLALFQQKLTQAVGLPIFTSSLLQLPMLTMIFGKQKILVVTANSATLTPQHIAAVCGSLDTNTYDIVGLESMSTATNFTVQNWDVVDTDICEQELLETVKKALQKAPVPYGALLLECTNLPPYSDVLRETFNLPVYDFVTLTTLIHTSYCKNGFSDIKRYC